VWFYFVGTKNKTTLIIIKYLKKLLWMILHNYKSIHLYLSTLTNNYFKKKCIKRVLYNDHEPFQYPYHITHTQSKDNIVSR